MVEQVDGQVVMVNLDVDNGVLYFGKQGTWFNNGTSDNSDSVLGQIEAGTTTTVHKCNWKINSVFVRQTSNNTLICNFGQDSKFHY